MIVEPDIDYFKDIAAHLILEVLVNAFGSLTDPSRFTSSAGLRDAAQAFPSSIRCIRSRRLDP